MSTAPKDWWSDHQGTRPGPARIRVTFNRLLTHAEKEHLRSLSRAINDTMGDKFRVADDGRVYVESKQFDSRSLFMAVAAVVSHSFVNVFPIAVRTFRELNIKVNPSAGLMNTVTSTAGSATIIEYRNEPVKQKRKAKKKP